MVYHRLRTCMYEHFNSPHHDLLSSSQGKSFCFFLNLNDCYNFLPLQMNECMPKYTVTLRALLGLLWAMSQFFDFLMILITSNGYYLNVHSFIQFLLSVTGVFFIF